MPFETQVVSYYTRGTPYVAEAARLEASGRKAGVPVLVRAVPDAGDWNLNTALKPIVLAEIRDKLQGPLLYVDADAWLHKDPRPDMDEIAAKHEMHLGLHYFRQPRDGQVPDRGWRMLTGTMLLPDNQECRDLLNCWCAYNAAARAKGDIKGGGQRNLYRLIAEGLMAPTIFRLPGRYCYIFDKGSAYDEGTLPVIEHLQASRENRDQSRGMTNEARRRRIAELVTGV